MMAAPQTSPDQPVGVPGDGCGSALFRLLGKDSGENDAQHTEFSSIIETILVLQTPICIESLSKIVSIPLESMKSRLSQLHAVLDLAFHPDMPMETLQSSLEKLLLNTEGDIKSSFSMDYGAIHASVADRCLELLSEPECLQENICCLPSPGTLRSEVSQIEVDKHLPKYVQYACRYWVYHLEHGKSATHVEGSVHGFLQKHLLHWLEALSLVGGMNNSLSMVEKLLSISKTDKASQLRLFLNDLRRLILQNQWIIENAPLQLYSSVVIFLPETSIIKQTFKSSIPRWVQSSPKVQETWGSVLQVLGGHNEKVACIGYSSDGERLVSAGADATIRLWDTSTGTQLQMFKQEKGTPYWVAISPNGKLVASGGWDFLITIWDVATNKQLRVCRGHQGDINCIAFSPDAEGKFIASASDDRTVRLWQTATGYEVRSFEGHLGIIHSVAFSRDGKMLASAAERDPYIRLWDVETGKLQHTLDQDYSGSRCVVFSPDGLQLAAVSFAVIKIWDVKTKSKVHEFQDRAWHAAFSQDSSLFAWTTVDNVIRVHDLRSGGRSQTISGPNNMASSIAFSPDGMRLASGWSDFSIRIWDIATVPAEPDAYKGRVYYVEVIAISPDARHFASASDDDIITLWDVATGEKLREFPRSNDRVLCMAFSPDGAKLASGSYDFSATVWDVATGSKLYRVTHNDQVEKVAFAPYGNILVSGSREAVVISNTTTKKLIQVISDDGGVFRISPLPESSQWALCVPSGIMIWDENKGQLADIRANPNAELIKSALGFESSLKKDLNERTLEYYTSLTRPANQPDSRYNISMDDGWVTRAGERLLWLPTDYRTRDYDVKDNVVVFAFDSGQVTRIIFCDTPSI